MKRILLGIDSLEQHQKTFWDEPNAYRPERCPHCGKAGVHCHGHYERNAPRGEGMAMRLEKLFITRFITTRVGAPAHDCRAVCRQDTSMLTSTNSGGKCIVARYSSCQSQLDHQATMDRLCLRAPSGINGVQPP